MARRTNDYGKSRCIARFALVLIASLATSMSCSLQDFEYMQSELNSGGSAAMIAVGGIGTTGGTTDTSVALTGGTTPGGSSTLGSSGGVSSTGGSRATSTLGPPTIGPWNFDTVAQISDWGPTGTGTVPDATVSWTSQGESDPLGSLVTFTTGMANFSVAVPSASADLSHRKVYFRVRTDTGSAKVKPYAQSTGWAWGDAGEQPVSTTWSTAVLDFDALSYESATFDSKSLINFGLQELCPGTPASPVTWTIWVDRVWLE